MSAVSGINSTVPYALTSAAPGLTASTDSATATGSTGKNQNIDAVSKDFEAVFLSQMMGAMFNGDEFTAYFGGGTAGEIYKSFTLNEYGKAMSQAGGIGIASVVKQELLKMQEVTQ